MKKLLTIMVISGLFLVLSGSLYAQESSTQESHGNALNVFVKFGDNSSISAHYEFAVTQDITISPEARIWFSGKNDLAIGARGDFYFDRLFKLVEPWDIWGGVDLGFVVSGDENKDDFDLNIHIGGEYKFNDMWGIILEIGGGTTAAGGIGVGVHF